MAAAAAAAAGWSPSPLDLNYRCVEILEYAEGGELVWHRDEGSVYTMVLLLTPTSEFTGANFVLAEDFRTSRQFTLTPAHRGGLIFISTADHNLQPVLSGSRKVFAVEFWVHYEVQLYDLRPGIP